MTFQINLNLVGIAVYIIWDLMLVGTFFLRSCQIELSLLKSARFIAIQVLPVRLKDMMINDSQKHTHTHIYHIYTYIYTHGQTFIPIHHMYDIYIYAFISIYSLNFHIYRKTPAHVHVCKHIFTYVHKYFYTSTCISFSSININPYTKVHIYIYIFQFSHININANTYINKHIHIHIYLYLCTLTGDVFQTKVHCS